MPVPLLITNVSIARLNPTLKIRKNHSIVYFLHVMIWKRLSLNEV